MFYVDSDGTRLKGDVFSVGSGSTFAYGVLDQGYRWDLTDEEALELGRRSIYAAGHRDAFSGNTINLYHVQEDGWKFIGTSCARVQKYAILNLQLFRQLRRLENALRRPEWRRLRLRTAGGGQDLSEPTTAGGCCPSIIFFVVHICFLYLYASLELQYEIDFGSLSLHRTTEHPHLMSSRE